MTPGCILGQWLCGPLSPRSPCVCLRGPRAPGQGLEGGQRGRKGVWSGQGGSSVGIRGWPPPTCAWSPAPVSGGPLPATCASLFQVPSTEVRPSLVPSAESTRGPRKPGTWTHLTCPLSTSQGSCVPRTLSPNFQKPPPPLTLFLGACCMPLTHLLSAKCAGLSFLW